MIRSKVSSTRFLYSLKVAKAKNVNSIGVGGVGIESLISEIAEHLAETNILLYKLISFILNINVFG